MKRLQIGQAAAAAVCLVGALLAEAQTPLVNAPPGDAGRVNLMVVAGSSNVSPAESPASRVDPNTVSSLYAGVGSVRVQVGANTYIGTGTPLTPTHILTAAHVLDIDGNGTPDTTPSNVQFWLNYGGSPSHIVTASALHLHPAYNGHMVNLNDDLAIIQLSSPLPAGVPTYDIVRTSLVYQTAITVVGYGWSGYGNIGYTVAPSYVVKRAGTNFVDGVWSWDDEGTNTVFEVWYGDFDWPNGVNTGFVGGVTVGNRLETTFGGGDSGGPGFIWDGTIPKIVSVNTFTFSMGTTNAPTFGSGLGGIHIPAYSNWIDNVAGIPEPQTILLSLLGTAAALAVRRFRERAEDPPYR
ncbi:MAG: trypsin-like peptidase domain-containing protein [Kiritimatiellae bacterium]|nr:trypsin-like peptidase domain-containing protein [Kiritimatiellia bacterium]